jgi:hypothetical protein
MADTTKKPISATMTSKETPKNLFFRLDRFGMVLLLIVLYFILLPL